MHVIEVVFTYFVEGSMIKETDIIVGSNYEDAVNRVLRRQSKLSLNWHTPVGVDMINSYEGSLWRPPRS